MKKIKNEVASVDSSQKIPFGEMLAYGSAEIYGGGSATLISLVLLFYLNIILGIPAAWAGAIILVSKAWDAISDPLMGVISDNTRFKFGRRKPYIIAGSIMTFFSMLFLFAPIHNLNTSLKVFIAMIAYIFFCTSNTVSQVPFCSLAADISELHKERNKANTVKLGFSMVGAAICFLVPTILMDNIIAPKHTPAPDAPMKMFVYIGVVFAFIFAIPLLICGIFSKERVHYDKNIKSKFSFKSYLEPFKIKSYRWHLVMYICAFLCMDLISALVFYYIYIIADGVTITLFGKVMTIGSSLVVAPMMLIAALFIPLVLILAKKKSKQFAFRLGLPLYVLGGILLASYQKTWSGWCIPIFAIIMGIGIAGAQSMPWMIFPDTVDAAALKLGTKPTGTFSGLMTFSRKFTQAISIFLVGVIFEAIGIYKNAQTGKIDFKKGDIVLTQAEQLVAQNKATTAIRVLIIVVVVLLIVTAFVASFLYKLDSKKLNRIKYFLDKQQQCQEENQEKDSNLTEEEIREKQELIKKYS